MQSDMKALLNSINWSQTSLGPKENWPVSLKTVVNVVINSKIPMHLSWGPDLIQFYNDANRVIIGDNHPAMGKSVYDSWVTMQDQILPLIKRVMAGESLNIENHTGVIYKNGKPEECHFTMAMTPVTDDSGKIAGVLTTTLEITNRLIHERLFDIMMQAPLPMTIVEGPEYHYIFSNPPHDEMVGRKVQGKKLSEAFTVEEIGNAFQLVDKIFTDGEPIITRENPLALKDREGKKINKWVDIGLYPYRGPEGKVKGFISIAADVTEAVSARNKIEKALKSRDEFISIASHEFKTPVSSLKLQFQMIERNMKKGIPFTEDHLKKMLNLSLRQIEGLSRLIEDLLDATKASNERMSFKFQESEISSIVTDAIGHVSTYLEDHETPLTSHVDETLKLNCDPFRIEQVITNLLTNASKYGDYKPISLDVKREKDAIKIIVRDHGIGIGEENFGKIFDRFERGSVTKNYAGLGLGLFITKHIVDAHNGSIDVESKLGHGSTFTVTLPMHH